MTFKSNRCIKLHSLNIPITVILHVDKKCLHIALALFTDLKIRSSDKAEVSFEELNFKVLADDLGVKSQKTIKKYFNWLLKNKWISINSKRGVYHFKSFRWLHKKVINTDNTLYSPKIVLWEERLEMANFKAFIYASIITFYGVSKQAYEYYQQKRNGVKSECPASSPRLDSNTLAFELPVRYLAEAYGISPGKAVKMKKVAASKGYLVINEQNQIIRSNTSFIEFFHFRKYAESSEQHFFRNGTIYRRGSNQFKSNVRLKKTKSYAI